MNKSKDILIIGFALFSMFFGAGNLIFPPYIGISSGNNWLISFLGFIIADVGIILLSVISVSKAGGLQNVIGKAGKNFGLILEFLMMLCLGPILVIPRTGATTFEMSILPLFKDFNPFLFSLIFFAITLLLTIKPNKVMDIIGKFLTPVLLISLIFLIIKGIVSPIGNLKNISSKGFFITGVTQGYQTMDALGMGGVISLIMASLISKGYTDKNENISLAIKSALIACTGLTIIYGGLTYLGATASSLYDTNIPQTVLLINITNKLLGHTGTIILSIVVGFACLTTSIGLTSVTSKFFEDFTNKKLKYEHIVIFICVFSAIVSNLGVDKIIKIAVPILSLIYPVTIILSVLSLFKNLNNMVLKGSAYFTLIISLLNVIDSLGINIKFIHHLPFASLGFNWILPAIIGGILFNLIPSKN